MSTLFPAFFESNEYFIDEKVQFLKFENAYKVYDREGLPIGNIVQRISGWHKFLRLFLKKAMFPFTMEVVDAYDNVLVTIKRGWTFWLSKVTITDAQDNTLGIIRQKFSFLKPTFRISNSTGEEIALIKGDWKAWNFTIYDKHENTIGQINKKWAGLMKEAFTTADKYYVTIVPEYAEDTNKINIVSTAICIDMILKESK